MSLSQVGVNSLLAVNQWIGLINSNLISTSRTAYKTSRISFADGSGINSVTTDRLIPPATMNVQATTIEWDQGSIVNSISQTHFAIQGEGFFVLNDPSSGKYFLSRDGEFHWAGGYLVNSAGLRVVSSGQDFVRMGEGDASDLFNTEGYSRDLTHFGDKSFLLLDVLNRDNLRMSQYGSTVFELDGNLTTRLDNDFNTTTDGVTYVYDDPSIIPIVNDPKFVTVANPPLIPNLDFSINFGNVLNGGNGVFTFAGFNPNPGGTTIQQIITAINAFNPGNVVATFDSLRDRLILENRVGPGGDNSISFGGVNGQAIADFFRLNSDDGVQDELATPLFETNIITSQGDIDNSALNPTKDIDYPGFVGPPPHAALPLTTPIGNLITPKPVYIHTKGAGGFIEADAANVAATTVLTGIAPGASMILGESATSDQFDVVMEIKVSDTDKVGPGNLTPSQGLIVFAFGQQDGHSLNSGGFEIVYNPSTAPITLTSSVPPILLNPGQVVLRTKPGNYDEAAESPQVAGPPQNIGSISDNYFNLAANAVNRMVVKLDGDKKLTFSVDGAVATWDIGGGGQNIAGHLTLRNTDNILQLHSLHTDFKRSANAATAGEMVPVNIPAYASFDKEEYRFRPRSRIVQNALETSNASLTEYVPMLSLAQKVFSAVSKIISVYNSTIDDLNATLR